MKKRFLTVYHDCGHTVKHEFEPDPEETKLGHSIAMQMEIEGEGLAGKKCAQCLGLIDAGPQMLAALRLVLALHDARDKKGPSGAVPGYRVHLDPKAEAQVRAAVAMAEGK